MVWMPYLDEAFLNKFNLFVNVLTSAINVHRQVAKSWKKLQLQSQIAVHCRKSRPKCTKFSNLAVVALEETIPELKANTRKDEL